MPVRKIPGAEEDKGGNVPTRHEHRLRNWVVAGIVVVVVLAVGGPFVYIHFIEGPAPAKLTLPGDQTSTTGNAATSGVIKGSAGQVNGTWNVGQGSIVGYRVGEVLIGQNSTAVGRTEKVWGSLTVDGGSVTKGTFTVNMASVTSDQSERNAQFDGRIMDVSTYPTAEFVITKPILLGGGLSAGTVERYPAAGPLTMHGVTKPVDFNVSMELTGSGAYVLAEIPIVFADWDISNPSVGRFVTTNNSGTLEVLLHLVRGAGNPVSNGSSESSTGGGPGGPVTVPSTTVPPLTVPRS
jgi:polyisoprenoid-binding protein YceI